jgi:hypothetical protein
MTATTLDDLVEEAKEAHREMLRRADAERDARLSDILANPDFDPVESHLQISRAVPGVRDWYVVGAARNPLFVPHLVASDGSRLLEDLFGVMLKRFLSRCNHAARMVTQTDIETIRWRYARAFLIQFDERFREIPEEPENRVEGRAWEAKVKKMDWGADRPANGNHIARYIDFSSRPHETFGGSLYMAINGQGRRLGYGLEAAARLVGAMKAGWRLMPPVTDPQFEFSHIDNPYAAWFP